MRERQQRYGWADTLRRRKEKALNVALWIAAGVLATVLLISTSKAFVPREKIAAVGGPAAQWVEDFSPSALRAIATLELLAAAGLILPAALDIAPVLVPLAATGTALLFIGAVTMRLRPRREGNDRARPGLSRPGHIRGVGPLRPRVLYQLSPIDAPGPSDGLRPRRPRWPVWRRPISSAGVNARVIRGDEAVWRPSNLMGVENTDLAKQLGATTLGARFWRLRPGQASTQHRHRSETELYVVVEGTGRIRISEEPAITLPPHSAVLVEPATVRQVFNDTDRDALWLVVGAPPEALDPLAMTEADLAFMYPDGPEALPPELSSGPAGD